MRASNLLRRVLTAAILFELVCFCGCNKAKISAVQNKNDVIYTWDLDEKPFSKDIFSPQIESLPPENAAVWGGTVSHHLLANEQIDRWFYEISKRRKVKNFFIICPSHYGLSTQTWSLANCKWKTKRGLVETNLSIERKMAEKLGVSFEPQVFPIEHGVNVLIPYISRYFPDVKICAVAVHGEPPLNQFEAQKLADVISPYFSDSGKRENFLLISTDFAHHGNFEETLLKDTRSRQFFNEPSAASWIFCGCDNRPGIYVLSRFLTKETKNAVLYHTNSFELSGQDGNDITSYFFSLFYD